MKLFEISYTQADGRKIEGQLYTADTVSNKLVTLVKENATNILVKESKET